MGYEKGIPSPFTMAKGDGAELLGVFAIQSATERRSVAEFVSAPFSVERADILYLGIPKALAEARLQEAREGQSGTVPLDEPKPQSLPTPLWPTGDDRFSQCGGPAPAGSATGQAIRRHGRPGDDDTVGKSLEEEAKRSYSTPTLRLQARARELPGGFRLGTSMRLSHRTSPNGSIQPTTSLRFYQFDLEKTFETVPLQLHLGRFHNPFDDYSGYWDGLMVHYGEDGLGGGVALGFEPELWNEGVSTQRPKVSGFLDYSAGGEAAEYEGAFSFSAIRPESGQNERTYVGLTQRLRLGGAWIRQRLQLDRSVDGAEWSMTRFQLDASIPLTEGLSAHGGWRRWRPFYAGLPIDPLGARQDRASLGLSYWNLAGGLSADISLDRPEEGEEARTVSSSFFVRRSPLLGLGFSGTASYWTRGEVTSLLLSPEIRRGFGRTEVRGGYRFYETAGGFGENRTHFADLSLSFPLGGGISGRLHGFVQWGDSYSSNRILASLWKSF